MDANNYGSSARSRIFVRQVKSHVSPTVNDFFNNCPTLIDASAMYNTGLIETNMVYTTGYNNLMHSGIMYSDDVLYKSGEGSDFWDSAIQSNDQVMSNAYPSLVGSQTNYYGTSLSYYPNPIAPTNNPASATQSKVSPIDPMVTMISSSNLYNSASFTQGNVDYMNTKDRLYSQFDCQITPQSQMLSTPHLGYHGSPSSPTIDGSSFDCKVEDHLYEDSLPTDLLSPFVSPNSDFISSWPANIKYEDTNFLGDCDFWNNGIN